MTIQFIPNVDRLIDTAFIRNPEQVPNFEISVDSSLVQQIIGRLARNLQDEIEFRIRCGYDFVTAAATSRGKSTRKLVWQNGENKGQPEQKRKWVDEHSVQIKDWHDFKNYEFPSTDQVDLSKITDAVKAVKGVPGRMGVVAVMVSAPFMESWYLMGFEGLCYNLKEKRELVKAVADKIGAIGLETVKKICREEINFLHFADDIAHSGGLMISPKDVREIYFPWYCKFIEVARDNNIPISYHSDGNIEEIIPDFIDAGLNAINPIEPKAMDIFLLKKKYGDRLAFFGNVDVDLLARGNPEQVRESVRGLIAHLAPGGGYAVSSSNTVPDYVSLENYLAMVETTLDYRRYHNSQ